MSRSIFGNMINVMPMTKNRGEIFNFTHIAKSQDSEDLDIQIMLTRYIRIKRSISKSSKVIVFPEFIIKFNKFFMFSIIGIDSQQKETIPVRNCQVFDDLSLRDNRILNKVYNELALLPEVAYNNPNEEILSFLEDYFGEYLDECFEHYYQPHTECGTNSNT